MVSEPKSVRAARARGPRSALEFEEYLHRNVPMARAMQIRVMQLDADTVVLEAPLEPNLNPHGSAFGGSVSALAILAAWSLLDLRVSAVEAHAAVVIQRHALSYTRPIEAAFSACATLAAPEEWPRFLQLLARRGRARIGIAAIIASAGDVVGQFSGDYVASRLP